MTESLVCSRVGLKKKKERGRLTKVAAFARIQVTGQGGLISVGARKNNSVDHRRRTSVDGDERRVEIQCVPALQKAQPAER